MDNSFENFKNYKPDNPLVKHLVTIPIYLNSFAFYVGEIKYPNSEGKLQTVEGIIKNAMYPENYLTNKKILVVMLYSAEMNLRENSYLSYSFKKKLN